MSDNKILLDIGITASHIIIATILVLCLKKYNNYILTVLLLIMVGVISYQEINNIPIYTLIMIGLIFYLINMIIIDQNDTLDYKPKFISNLWQIPYFGIVSYYIILLSGHILSF